MGLQERRALKAFQDNEYKELEGTIHSIAGTSLEIQVDWDSLCEDDMSHLYQKAFTSVYFEPITEALKAVCIDDMGKEAIADGLNKIIIQNKDNITNVDVWAKMSNRVLTLDHKPFSNIDYASRRAEALQAVLEDNL